MVLLWQGRKAGQETAFYKGQVSFKWSEKRKHRTTQNTWPRLWLEPSFLEVIFSWLLETSNFQNSRSNNVWLSEGRLVACMFWLSSRLQTKRMGMSVILLVLSSTKAPISTKLVGIWYFWDLFSPIKQPKLSNSLKKTYAGCQADRQYSYLGLIFLENTVKNEGDCIGRTNIYCYMNYETFFNKPAKITAFL